MRAVVYSQTGDPDVLHLAQRPVPEPGPGEVRVRVSVSGVNPTDWKARRGGAAGGPVDPAQVPNQDGAGTVDAVGEGVDASRVGERYGCGKQPGSGRTEPPRSTWPCPSVRRCRWQTVCPSTSGRVSASLR